MEINSSSISRCSKHQHTIYQDWFNFADSGHHLSLSLSPSHLCLISLTLSLSPLSLSLSSLSSPISLSLSPPSYDKVNHMTWLIIFGVLVWIDDSDRDGRLTGADAIKFFSMSNLPRPDLKQVYTYLCFLIIDYRLDYISLTSMGILGIMY